MANDVRGHADTSGTFVASPISRVSRVTLLALFALSTVPAFSEPFTFGFKGGVPMIDLLSTRPALPGFAISNTNPYIVGPTIELRLPANLAVEFDALLRHFRYRVGQGPLIGGFQETVATSNAWEFPLLLKYKLPAKVVRPYIDGGVAWDHLQGISATVTDFGTFGPPITTPTSNPPELQKTSTGIVIGGGVEIHALFLRVSPEIRYTRWVSQHVAEYILYSNQNQVDFLLGITF